VRHAATQARQSVAAPESLALPHLDYSMNTSGSLPIRRCARITIAEVVHDVAKVFIVVRSQRALHRARVREYCGLRADKASSDESHCSERIQGGSSRWCPRETRLRQAILAPQRARPHSESKFFHQFRDCGKTLGGAAEKSSRFRIVRQNVSKCGEERSFFILQRAAANSTGSVPCLIQALAQACHDCRRQRRRDIELQIAGNRDA